MDGFIVTVLALMIVIVLFWGWLRSRRRLLAAITSASAPTALDTLLEKIDTTPDAPVNFGYKNSWLAIRASNAEDVIRSVSIDNVQSANWRTGFIAAYNGHAFVSPPVDGWVLVVSDRLPGLGHEPDTEEWISLMRSLSEKHGDVQYFGTHRVVGYHAWSRFVDGREQRAFAYSGESGETLVDRGARTAGETELGYNYFDPNCPEAKSNAYWEREDLCYPDEEHVMEIAGKWSINPMSL